MNYDISLEETYPHPIERIWEALTDSQALGDWLMPNDFEPTLGHKFQFRFKPMPGWRGWVDCEVIEVDKPKRLAYTWKGDDDWTSPTIVRWTLESVEGGTRLRFEHTGFQDPWGAEVSKMMSQGWPKIVRHNLSDALARFGPRGYEAVQE